MQLGGEAAAELFLAFKRGITIMPTELTKFPQNTRKVSVTLSHPTEMS